MRKPDSAKLILATLAAASLAGCALYPSWHWAKPGADEENLRRDEIQCKSRVYSDASGFVTKASVRRMHSCMEGKGWSRQEN